MRACNPKDRVLSQDAYHQFKNALRGFLGSFSVKPQPLAKDLVSLTECRLQLNPPLGTMTEAEQEKHWHWVLEVCKTHGLERVG
jgi:hypothetical protein